MKGVIKFQDKLKSELKNRKFKEAFDQEEIYSRLAIRIAALREEKGWSQKELARQLHTTQQNVSRLEDPHNQSFSLSTLIKLARTFRKNLDIEFTS